MFNVEIVDRGIVEKEWKTYRKFLNLRSMKFDWGCMLKVGALWRLETIISHIITNQVSSS